ncbi:thermonuclease family protein [Nitrospirota bacterium]
MIVYVLYIMSKHSSYIRLWLLTTLFVLLFAITSPVEAKGKVYGTAIVLKVVSVYDGDTFRADLDGYPDIVGKNIGIRVNGIDTPEMRDKNPQVKALAIKAKEYAFKSLTEGKVIELRNMKRGKYFRIVADVYVDEVNLGKALVEAGLAVPYDGGTKPDWSELIKGGHE